MRQKNLLYFAVTLIGALLVLDIILTRYNNIIIQHNKTLQAETEQIKIYHDQVGKVLIHALDLGLRGYALVPSEKLAKPMENVRAWKDSIYNNVEVPLQRLHFNLTEFHLLKDSINAYIVYNFHLKQLLDEGKSNEFMRTFATDRGAALWWQYLLSERSISEFTDRIHDEAQVNYEAALYRNQILQIILFFICFPTLLYTAFHTRKTFSLSEQLRRAEEEKNMMLLHQNADLEREVLSRTQELAAQNEEILAQSEELAVHRDHLAEQNTKLIAAQKFIEEQNVQIQQRNDRLEEDVQNRTRDLENTNLELIDHNNQLEQFAFISAHNLRAPVARLLGLTNLLQHSADEAEKDFIVTNISSSASDLDSVIRDLSTILEIKKHTSDVIAIDLQRSVNRVIKAMSKEITDTDATVTCVASGTNQVTGVVPYVESILYNLLSNAIKYRHPERKPVIEITIDDTSDGFVSLHVRDNGLGIDLNRHRQDIFNLYKRFHTHVEGKGMGLYLVRTQMIAMGGQIEIESVPGAGTTFHLYFKN